MVTSRPYYYLGNQRALIQLDNGLPFFVTTRDASISPWLILGGIWETFVDRIFRKLVRPGDHVADAGANMGYYTILAAHLAGPDGRVWAFEPNPELYEILDLNISINGFDPRVKAFPIALGDCRTTATLGFGYKNMGGGTFLHNEFTTQFVDCQIAPMAELIGPQKLDILKLDVEGYEKEVLLGAHAILDASPKLTAIVEVPTDVERARWTLEFLLNQAFMLHYIDFESRLHPTSLEQFFELRAHKTSSYVLASRDRTRLHDLI